MTGLAKRTWPEAVDLFRPDVVALLPIGSTEPHGPHLPLDTDVTIALAQAKRAQEHLENAGVSSFVLPPLPYGVTHWTTGFPGTVTLRPGTLWSFLEDVVTSLEEQGVRRVVFCNGHLEPEHIAVLRGVVMDHASLTEDTAQVLFPDNTRRRWASTLGDEFAGGDCHAGRYETSLVLAADPEGARPEEAAALPSVEIGLVDRIREGARSFRECGADQAYCGAPSEATASEGHDLVDRLATMVLETVREAWPELFIESSS